jgi:hypothetical protein
LSELQIPGVDNAKQPVHYAVAKKEWSKQTDAKAPNTLDTAYQIPVPPDLCVDQLPVQLGLGVDQKPAQSAFGVNQVGIPVQLTLLYRKFRAGSSTRKSMRLYEFNASVAGALCAASVDEDRPRKRGRPSDDAEKNVTKRRRTCSTPDDTQRTDGKNH